MAAPRSREEMQHMETSTDVMTDTRGITVNIACTIYDLLHAQRLVAENYALLSVPTLSVDEVYAEFYPLHESVPELCVHNVTTFVAWESDQIVATMSLIWCQSRAAPRQFDQIEGLRLLRSARPWSEVLGVAPQEIGELTRFAIRRDHQGSNDAARKIQMFRSLLYEVLDFAERQQVGVVVAIMPPTVTRLVTQASVAIYPIPGVQLAHEDAYCAALYQKYPRYWLPKHSRLIPKLYAFGHHRLKGGTQIPYL
jgi:hypothetical protein